MMPRQTSSIRVTLENNVLSDSLRYNAVVFIVNKVCIIQNLLIYLCQNYLFNYALRKPRTKHG